LSVVVVVAAAINYQKQQQQRHIHVNVSSPERRRSPPTAAAKNYSLLLFLGAREIFIRTVRTAAAVVEIQTNQSGQTSLLSKLQTTTTPRPSGVYFFIRRTTAAAAYHRKNIFPLTFFLFLPSFKKGKKKKLFYMKRGRKQKNEMKEKSYNW
jgi:hypothetical protein